MFQECGYDDQEKHFPKDSSQNDTASLRYFQISLLAEVQTLQIRQETLFQDFFFE